MLSQNLNFPTASLSVATALLLWGYSHTSLIALLYSYSSIEELQILGAIDQVFHFITSGSIGGLPPIVLMVIIFVIGLVVGYLIHLFLKIAIIAAIILVVVSYFGLFGLSLSALKDLAAQYGSIVYQYGVLLIGMLPLGIGFIVGLIIGFIFA
jgi:uncharacterized membrane protein (Fun14 family)